jgi:hypothetical protein
MRCLLNPDIIFYPLFHLHQDRNLAGECQGNFGARTFLSAAVFFWQIGQGKIQSLD